MASLEELAYFIERQYTNCENEEEALMFEEVLEQLHRLKDLEK